jgi:hypothetical protein
MGIVYNYVRLTPARLDELRADPELVGPWAMDVIRSGAFLDIGKVWAGIHTLLRGLDLPVDVIYGGAGFGEADDFMGIRFFTPQEVSLAAQWFTLVDIQELIDGVEPGTRTYYVSWEHQGRLEELKEEFGRLIACFAAAADRGDAVVRWQS